MEIVCCGGVLSCYGGVLLPCVKGSVICKIWADEFFDDLCWRLGVLLGYAGVVIFTWGIIVMPIN